ncbi:hypothetical protein P280DRAFT_484745 [Massarina eburnea CBS 473.64]|uniref:Uncharacterized protein n=1 Tax=Massarina eburnea CBS 473.64 TaxID=1395130 RepID=A0A6A6RJB7_9PLEO|nr:hypothetical protein P280DRAFT_484745 [Massarina eburnea CBS 473.64]
MEGLWNPTKHPIFDPSFEQLGSMSTLTALYISHYSWPHGIKRRASNPLEGESKRRRISPKSYTSICVEYEVEMLDDPSQSSNEEMADSIYVEDTSPADEEADIGSLDIEVVEIADDPETHFSPMDLEHNIIVPIRPTVRQYVLQPTTVTIYLTNGTSITKKRAHTARQIVTYGFDPLTLRTLDLDPEWSVDHFDRMMWHVWEKALAKWSRKAWAERRFEKIIEGIEEEMRAVGAGQDDGEDADDEMNWDG